MFRSKIRYTADEYIERILCTVPGMLHKGNIFLMEKALAGVNSTSPVLEIGSFCGQSAIVLTYLLRKTGKPNKVVCVDPFLYEGWADEDKKTDTAYLNSVGGNKNMSRKDYLSFVKQSFHFHTGFFLKNDVPELHQIKSDEYFKQQPHQEYAFVFIDGGHSLPQCKRDVENAGKGLKKGSYLLLDDSAKGSHLGSAVFASTLTNESGFEVTDRNPHCLLRKIK